MKCGFEFVLLVLTLCFFPLSASPQERPENSQTQSVHGVVINSITREPIGRALVSSPDNRFATMTDSEGRFEFTIPRSGNAPSQGEGAGTIFRSGTGYTTWFGRLTARKPGFLSDPNEPMQNVQFSSDQEVTLSLVPEALIVGRVVLPSSDGATPIQLQLYRRQVQEGRAHWVPAGDTTARSNGDFRFAELAPGLYKLFTLELLDRDPETFRRGAQLYGYPPIYFPAARSFASAATIRLAAGKTFHADLSPVRQPYYNVKVPVANAVPGMPVGVTVMVQGNRGPGFSLGYNDRDRTIEGMLPNGVYALEASGFGTPVSNGVVNITVRDAPVDGPPLMLVSNASIPVNLHWELTSPEGRNLPAFRRGERYANVRLEPADDFGQERSVFLRPLTGGQVYSPAFDGVAPGRYWLHVDSGIGFPSAVSFGGIDLLRHPLVVGAVVGNAPVEITMRDEGAEIEGTVEGLSNSLSKARGDSDVGNSIPYQASTYVYCVPLPDSTGQFAQTPVGQNGEFTFPRVAPGTYRLLAFPRQQPELEYENPEAMRAYDSKGLIVRLVAGQKEHVRLPLISPSE